MKTIKIQKPGTGMANTRSPGDGDVLALNVEEAGTFRNYLLGARNSADRNEILQRVCDQPQAESSTAFKCL